MERQEIIQYALVAKDRETILAEYTKFSGNFQQAMRMLLPKLKPGNKQTLEADKYFLSLIRIVHLFIV